MNIVALHGSPRRGRNSDTLTDQLLKGLTEKESHHVTHFYANEMNIKPCQGCLSCEEPPHRCPIDDDMQSIYKAYREADTVIWATPMYWGYMTAQLKAVQDRMEALAWEGFSDKTTVALITYRHHSESTADMFRRIAPHFRLTLHVLECQTYDPESGRDIPVEELTEKMEEAYMLGLKLGAVKASPSRSTS